jgi:hypothetical protein
MTSVSSGLNRLEELLLGLVEAAHPGMLEIVPEGNLPVASLQPFRQSALFII